MTPSPNTRKTILAIVLCSISLLLPIGVSLQLSWTQSETSARNESFSYARDVLRRAEKTSDQMVDAVKRVHAAHLPHCSEAELTLMRDIDLDSDYVQAIGRINNNTIACSSVTGQTSVPLHDPNFVAENGLAQYLNVRITVGQWRPLNIFALNGLAVITDPELPLDVSLDERDLNIAIVTPMTNKPNIVASRGEQLDPRWVRSIPRGTERSYAVDGYLVTAIRSSRYDLMVLVAVPRQHMYRKVKQIALIFVPLGVLCGAGLIWAGMYLARARSSFDSRLKAAIRRKEFYVEYQPIVDLRTERWTGAEALVRWRQGDTIIRPDYFIPMAEDRHLIRRITELVIDRVAEDLPEILKLDPAFKVAINLSPDDLRSQDTITMLERLLAIEIVCAANLEIEATEHAFADGQETRRVMEQIRSLGITVAIDDFGIGYSSLSRLQSFRFDTLKIDKSFVDSIGTDSVTSDVVLHIIDLARLLKLSVVAEGVESEAQASQLRAYGVKLAQGWHYSRSLPLPVLLDSMRSRIED
ncbi:EAL domain-containing protein [Terriglobus tenax]|uniref:EAL domain-containing protein n=1 Tax=Terriglobus tenax TaxID=1111115 RepID=UPI0021E004C8|nr:EAL domain-containing protein [Terriglobus tenax]